MKILSSLAGGLAGALSVTLLHEWLRQVHPGAPRLDRLGEQATARLVENAGGEPPAGEALYAASMAGDLVANTLYYSLAGARPDQPVLAGGLLGVSAGLGAVKLPSSLGLNEDFSAGTRQKAITTILLYSIGGLIAGTIIRQLK